MVAQGIKRMLSISTSEYNSYSEAGNSKLPIKKFIQLYPYLISFDWLQIPGPFRQF